MSRSNGIAIRLAFRASETKLTTRIVSADWIVWRCETIQILASLMLLLFYFFFYLSFTLSSNPARMLLIKKILVVVLGVVQFTCTRAPIQVKRPVACVVANLCDMKFIDFI